MTAPDADPQERAREGLEHLQAAARELIQAARAMLDVAEAVVDDPEAVGHLVGALGTVGDVVRQAAAAAPRAFRAPEGPGGGVAPQADAGPSGAPDGGERSSVRRISVL